MPKPLVFTLRPDGRLAGSGPVDVAGRVLVGVAHGIRTWSDGRTEAISTPVHEARTRRCNAGVLTTSGLAPPPVSVALAGVTVLDILSGGSGKEAAKTSPPGLRLLGEYGSRAKFNLDFRSDGVVVGCRDATIFRPYTAQLQGNEVLVKVQHGATPITLSMGSDGRLTGSGSVRVDGRTVTATPADGPITYAPRSETCALSILPAPQGVSANAGSGAAAPAAGSRFLLLNEERSAVLTQGGFQPAKGQSLLRTLALCQPTDPNCQRGKTALLGHALVAARSDAAGKAAFPGVAPGTYYLLGMTVSSNNQPILGNLKVQLKAGDNTLILDQRNATLVA